jgi:hypothetical protein
MVFMLSSAYAQTDVLYFHQIGCSHCAIVQDSGVLDRLDLVENTTVTQYEIRFDVKAQEVFLYYKDYFGIDNLGTPFMVINYSGKTTYLIGDKDIIAKSEKFVKTGNFGESQQTNSTISDKQITLGSIVVAALIDSINPCAFGVLIFLLISLLKVGSSKRALRYGLAYSFVVFIAYFLAGFGIFKAIQTVSYLGNVVYIVAGFLVLIFGMLEFIDFFRAGKDKKAILKIPTSAKPLLERMSNRATWQRARCV